MHGEADILFAVVRTLHQVSAVAFYLLGIGFFTAAVLLKNEAGGNWPAWWMQVADLPLALSAIVYAGFSLYQSMKPGDGHSRRLAWGIAIPLVTFFMMILVLNFWPQ